MLRLLSICKNSRLVYLTRFGNVPSEYSRKKKSGTDILPIDRIQCISWAKDICGWLNKLTAQLAEPRMEFIKNAVKNFEEHLLKHLKNL